METNAKKASFPLRNIDGLIIAGISGSVDIDTTGCNLIMAPTSHKKVAIVSCLKGLDLDSNRMESKIFLATLLLFPRCHSYVKHEEH